MAQYDENTYKYYIGNRDYIGAAEYLSTCTAKDGKSQIAVNNQIRELSIMGERQASMLEGQDRKNQDAYHFISALDGNGHIPHLDKNNENGNLYGDAYTGLINTLYANKGNISPGGRDVGGERIDRIRLEFNSSEAYKTYLDAIGSNYEDIYNLGVNSTRDSKTGHTFVDIPTSNIRMLDLIDRAKVLNTDIAIPTMTGVYYAKGAELYSIKGLTASNIIVPENRFNYDNIRQAKRLVDEARDIQNRIIDTNKSIDVYEETYITPYLGQGQANAHKDLQRGIIDEDEYKKITSRITDEYDRLLTLSTFQDKEVYVANDDTRKKKDEVSILRLIEGKDKDHIKDLLNAAAKDKRLTYAAGLRNGVSGTYIEVSQKINEKGEAVKGEWGQHMTVFVPGLFKSSCDEAFNADTKQMSVRDFADMKRWNYGRFLKDGNYVGHNKELGAYIQKTDENGKPVKVPISEQQALQLLNRNNIIEGSVNKLLSIVGNDGNPIEHLVSGQMVPYNIEEQAQLLSAAGTAELYQKGVYSDGERLQYQADIYNIIMKNLSNSIYKQNKDK